MTCTKLPIPFCILTNLLTDFVPKWTISAQTRVIDQPREERRKQNRDLHQTIFIQFSARIVLMGNMSITRTADISIIAGERR